MSSESQTKIKKGNWNGGSVFYCHKIASKCPCNEPIAQNLCFHFGQRP